MFFSDQRLHFFRPLVGKYREVVVECVRLLYQRLYTDLSGYGQGRSRDFIVDVFIEAIARAPVLDHEDGGPEGRFKNARELAGFILNNLLEYGWLERQLDEATLQSHYGFTRMGRAFTQPFIESGAIDYRSRNRNTRNTRNSLQAFLDNGEVYDLLDAYEYSERIISDFADTIAELEERRLQLVREVESRQLVEQAADQFFDFIDTVFKPDLEVRLSADSVEKYRDQISHLVRQIRRRRKFGGEGEQAGLLWQTVMEQRLRKLLPKRVVEGQSLLENLLNAIEERLRSACDIMLPALRRALNNFTARADMIIRQLSYLHNQSTHPVVEACEGLRKLSEQEQDAALDMLGQQWINARAGWLAAEQFQLRTRAAQRVVRAQVDEAPDLDSSAQQAQHIAQILDQAFHVSSHQMRDYVSAQLSDKGQVDSRELVVNDARDLLSLAHLVSIDGVSLETGHTLVVGPVESHIDGVQKFSPVIEADPYFALREGFVVKLIDQTKAS
ncbi:Wadjet anti-phage system protein JetA family protein [Simiduia aestuariiviva]|uniref:Wadjet anti-phage system protein JetA family protein n=1 Tax=Simiduia aestuariiviva TaxID=1510459 RepID=UPI00161887E6|nr:Wadjet anti-phage system protein JetA family protein [Simiduia aestuariiviva]